MKKWGLLLIYLFYSCLLLADEIEKLMLIKPVRIEVLAYRKDTNIAYLQTPFAQANIIKKINTNVLSNPNRIFAIHLVYTRYREVDSFNQPKLNYYRYQELKKLYPELIKNPNIHWKVIEQVKAKTKEDASKCFHGFVIFLKNEIPVKQINETITILKNITDSYKDSFVTIPPYKKIKIKKVKEHTGIYLPNNPKKRRNGITYTKPGIWGRTEKTITRKDTIVLYETPERTVNIGDFDMRYFENIDLYNTLKMAPKNSQIALIVDVTGSMARYNAEVLLFIKNRKHLINKAVFTFFNDGDNEPDQYKKIGKTGGVYIANNSCYDSIFATMATAMRNGTGGFPPENYCEAILTTLKYYPKTDTVLVIADMAASVSDIELLNEIKKPVVVLFAGDESQIPISFFNLAKQTGGHLLFKNQKINPIDAKKSKNSNSLSITIANKEYKIVESN